ncbi:MAG: hypothetical protein M3301_09750 [Chloroflexota bacterium]|nr:hypothetical protein [Chloroflexota bacterium]
MPDQQSGAQRASRHRIHALVMAFLLVGLATAGGPVARPGAVNAAGLKVVVVVGPVGDRTAEYIDAGRRIAAQARSYGAGVVEIYSPYATFDRVRYHAYRANLLVYIGHGNGWPSPYPPFQPYTKDGMGLNAVSGRGNYNLKYYGEYYVDRYIQLAPDAVVILHRLCYASGNSEWGSPDPSLSTARQRVDNFGAGFLRTGAKVVFAEGRYSTAYILYGLFRTNRSMGSIFWTSPSRTWIYRNAFTSSRTRGTWAYMDPERPGKYYRSIIGVTTTTAAAWRTP